MSRALTINKEPNGQSTAKVGELQYGSIIVDVPGCPNSVYMKVDNRNLGSGIRLLCKRVDGGSSVLINLNSGDLRMVWWDSVVTVMEGKLNISITNRVEEHKVMNTSASDTEVEQDNC